MMCGTERDDDDAVATISARRLLDGPELSPVIEDAQVDSHSRETSLR